MAKQVEQLEKEKKELQERLKNQEKKVTVINQWKHLSPGCELGTNCSFFQIDYFERAKRLEEIPLIKKAYEEQRVQDMELWELQEEERVCSKQWNPQTTVWLNTNLKGSLVVLMDSQGISIVPLYIFITLFLTECSFIVIYIYKMAALCWSKLC